MCGLDFSWRCDERRKDEIGALAASLNQLSDKLSAAMEELKTANRQLQEDSVGPGNWSSRGCVSFPLPPMS